MGDTNIEWTTKTWNPFVGCTKVSPGCAHCYAERMANRQHGMGTKGYANVIQPKQWTGKRWTPAHWTGKVNCLPNRLSEPLHWRKPCRIFVGSMGDLFHKDVPGEFLIRVFDVFRRCLYTHGHTFQVLTKRPARMKEFCKQLRFEDGRKPCLFLSGEPKGYGPMGGMPGCSPMWNVWLGTSVESAKYLDRIDHLRETPAAVRFLSLEPLLGPLPDLNLDGIDWVIVGGESGPGARPCHPDWVRDIRDQCKASGTAFFFKAFGEWVEAEGQMIAAMGKTWDVYRDDCLWLDFAGKISQIRSCDCGKNMCGMIRVGKKLAGRELDGRTWDEMPEVKT